MIGSHEIDITSRDLNAFDGSKLWNAEVYRIEYIVDEGIKERVLVSTAYNYPSKERVVDAAHAIVENDKEAISS